MLRSVSDRRRARSQDEDRKWIRTSACVLRVPGRMRGFLGCASFNIDDDYHSYNAFQWRLLCAEPDNQSDRCVFHHLRHADDLPAVPYTLAATPYCIAIAPGGDSLYVSTLARHLSLHHRIGRSFNSGKQRQADLLRQSRCHTGRYDRSWLVDAFVSTTRPAVQIECHSHQRDDRPLCRPRRRASIQTFQNLTNADRETTGDFSGRRQCFCGSKRRRHAC